MPYPGGGFDFLGTGEGGDLTLNSPCPACLGGLGRAVAGTVGLSLLPCVQALLQPRALLALCGTASLRQRALGTSCQVRTVPSTAAEPLALRCARGLPARHGPVLRAAGGLLPRHGTPAGCSRGVMGLHRAQGLPQHPPRSRVPVWIWHFWNPGRGAPGHCPSCLPVSSSWSLQRDEWVPSAACLTGADARGARWPLAGWTWAGQAYGGHRPTADDQWPQLVPGEPVRGHHAP